MNKREFLMKAKNYTTDAAISGWFWSLKYDGMRCFWDGGISRGKPANCVPWGHPLDKHISTGLWTSYGHVIHAPSTWIDFLPKYPLDGELDSANRQELLSITKGFHDVDVLGWMEKVRYRTFDMPPLSLVMTPGRINNPTLSKSVVYDAAFDDKRPPMQFIDVIRRLVPGPVTIPVTQTMLPYRESDAVIELTRQLAIVDGRGLEGLMLRAPFSYWEPKRTSTILKVKSRHDMEGVVVGYVSGAETSKGSKLLGKLGSITIRLPNGRITSLSGFTDAERELPPHIASWAISHPSCPIDSSLPNYPLGSSITFTYRGVTNDGIPTEMAYKRLRTED